MTTIFQDDTQVRDDVMAELDFEPEVEPGEIGVTVNDGVVSLLGTVDSYPMRQAAAAAAHRVRNVRAVANELEVKFSYDTTPTDESIANAAVEAVARHIQIPYEKPAVTVSVGCVTLTGEVLWQFQRQAAEHAVRPLAGVRAVINRITITHPVTVPDIKSKIEHALLRTAETDAHNIRVAVQGPTVVLSGTVRVWLEREEAQRAAWSTPGVTAVENNIVIGPRM